MFDQERQNMKDTTAFYAEQKRKDALQRERDRDLTGQGQSPTPDRCGHVP